MLCVLAFALVNAAPVDDRLVLQAPNLYGHQGLLHTTSALIGPTGAASLGVSTRLFFLPDFVLPGVADANTFVEGNVAAGFSSAHLVELVVQTRAGANLNNARAQPTTSVGDTQLGLKAGYNFGLVAAAAHYRAGLATGPRWRFWGNDWLSASLYGLLAWDVRHSVHAFTYRQPRVRVEARRVMNAVSASLGCALDVPVAGGVHARFWVDALDARYAWGGHTRDVDLKAPAARRIDHVMLSADLTTALELAYAF